MRETIIFTEVADGKIVNLPRCAPQDFKVITTTTKNGYTSHTLGKDGRPVDCIFFGFVGEDGSFLYSPTPVSTKQDAKHIRGLFIHPLNGMSQRTYAFLYSVFSAKKPDIRLALRDGRWPCTTIPGIFKEEQRMSYSNTFVVSFLNISQGVPTVRVSRSGRAHLTKLLRMLACILILRGYRNTLTKKVRGAFFLWLKN